jgi:hypothetical protein
MPYELRDEVDTVLACTLQILDKCTTKTDKLYVQILINQILELKR